MQKILLGIALAIVAIVVFVGIVIGGGLYNVAADEEHTGLVYTLLETARDRSIAARAADLKMPDLNDAQRIRRGAGNYDAMCVGCHLAPGAPQTEISRGLYPKAPNLSEATNLDPKRAFWAIKHGIKATGMPAWGKSMEDQYIWDMVALLRELPKMNQERYAAEVSASGGHSHGRADEHEQEEDDDASASGEHSHEHSHADTEAAPHSHATPATAKNAVSNSAVLRTVEQFHSALSAGDAAAVVRLLDEGVLIMEGGNVERSREEYAAHHLKSDLKFMKSVKYTLERQTGDSVGDLAWVASEAVMTGDSQGRRLNLVSTESLVLKRSAAGWRIVHVHWSSRERRNDA